MDASIDLIDRKASGETISGASVRALKRLLLCIALVAGVAVAADGDYRYWTVGRFLELTNDAYAKADYTTVAPKVSGNIAEMLVGDNLAVEAGQVLARIDDRDLRAALYQARADAAIRNLDAQTVLQRSAIEQEKADIAATAAVGFVRADDERYRDLMRRGSGIILHAQQAEAANTGSASALFNMMRNLGGAVGIAVLQAIHTKREQFHSNVLVQSALPFAEATRRVDRLIGYFLAHGVTNHTEAWHRAVVAIGRVVSKQAYIMAFGETFFRLGVMLVGAPAATLLLRKPDRFDSRCVR